MMQYLATIQTTNCWLYKFISSGKHSNCWGRIYLHKSISKSVFSVYFYNLKRVLTFNDSKTMHGQVHERQPAKRNFYKTSYKSKIKQLNKRSMEITKPFMVPFSNLEKEVSLYLHIHYTHSGN